MVEKVFHDYKFPTREVLLAYTPDKSSSLCGRIKPILVMCGRVFNQHLWMKKLSRMIIKKYVVLRSKFNGAVQSGFRSK